jgi:hypothetical protein
MVMDTHLFHFTMLQHFLLLFQLQHGDIHLSILNTENSDIHILCNYICTKDD